MMGAIQRWRGRRRTPPSTISRKVRMSYAMLGFLPAMALVMFSFAVTPSEAGNGLAIVNVVAAFLIAGLFLGLAGYAYSYIRKNDAPEPDGYGRPRPNVSEGAPNG